MRVKTKVIRRRQKAFERFLWSFDCHRSMRVPLMARLVWSLSIVCAFNCDAQFGLFLRPTESLIVSQKALLKTHFFYVFHEKIFYYEINDRAGLLVLHHEKCVTISVELRSIWFDLNLLAASCSTWFMMLQSKLFSSTICTMFSDISWDCQRLKTASKLIAISRPPSSRSVTWLPSWCN